MWADCLEDNVLSVYLYCVKQSMHTNKHSWTPAGLFIGWPLMQALVFLLAGDQYRFKSCRVYVGWSINILSLRFSPWPDGLMDGWGDGSEKLQVERFDQKAALLSHEFRSWRHVVVPKKHGCTASRCLSHWTNFAAHTFLVSNNHQLWFGWIKSTDWLSECGSVLAVQQGWTSSCFYLSVSIKNPLFTSWLFNIHPSLNELMYLS